MNIKKYSSLYIKELQGVQGLDYPLLHQDALRTQNHLKTKDDHDFLYPSDRQHSNVPVTVVDPSVNTL